MKKTKSSGFNTPFQNLSGVIKNQDKAKPSTPRKSDPSASPPEGQEDTGLFIKAMENVKPLSRKNVIVKSATPGSELLKVNDVGTEDGETLRKLRQLIDKGPGFTVSSTPEYMEGTEHQVHPEISRKLHRGKFSIQAHIDLHGMTVLEARAQFDDFLTRSIANNLRTLLVIHGRGLSSSKEPVLKSKVYEWLTKGPWRKYVIAFSSARSVDGGPGATYILLRKSPLTNKYRKKHKI
ncbi:MAG: DNA mismatch repair protein MutS [Desulfobacteraceae bacterium]|nr:DNA mismatch repair protein MutS [Desulfobacteraceae bacterium]